jgi:hypothetical protein
MIALMTRSGMLVLVTVATVSVTALTNQETDHE